jgi:hypothetical protein
MQNRCFQWLLVCVVSFLGRAGSQSAETNFAVQLSPAWHLIWPQLPVWADRYEVQSSPDLVAWHGLEGLTNISSQTASNGWFEAILPPPEAFEGSMQFFRVVAMGMPGETVELAEMLPGAGTYLGTTIGYQNNLSSGASCSGSAGVDRFYRITVPPFQRLTASVVNTNAAIVFDPSISLMQVPPPGTPNPDCITGDDSGAQSTINTVAYNNGADPTDILIRIDTASSTSLGGPYVLGVALSMVSPGDIPSLAENVSSNGVVSGSTTGYLNDASAYPGKSAPGRDRYYLVTLPPGLRLYASLFASSFNATLVMLDGTDPVPGTPPTLGIADFSSTGNAEILTYLNTGPTNMQIIVGIDSASSFAGGDFQLTLVTGPPPAGDVPATADLLSSVGTTSGAMAGFANDLSAYPGYSSHPGPDRFYRFAVPAGKILTVTIFPTNFNPALALLDAASTQGPNLVVFTLANIAGSNGAETARWFNASGNATELIIAVDSISTSTAGTFSLSLTLVDAPPGEAPLTAETLASTGTTSSTTVGYLNNLAPPSSCTGFATAGADRFFQILVPAGMRLTASVTPTSNWDPAIYFIRASQAGSDMPTCLAGDDSGAAATTNTAAYSNTTGTDEMIVIAIDALSTSATGTFDLVTSITNP